MLTADITKVRLSLGASSSPAIFQILLSLPWGTRLFSFLSNSYTPVTRE